MLSKSPKSVWSLGLQTCQHLPLATILFAAAWVSSAYADAVEPTGPLAEALIRDIKKAAELARIDTNGMTCSAQGNVNYGVTCKVSAYDLASASQRLKDAGWKPSATPPLAKQNEQASFRSRGLRLSLEVRPKASLWVVSASRVN